MPKILYLDTSSHEQITVALIVDGKREEVKSLPKTQKAENILPLIDGLLKKCRTKPEELTAIEVNPGPGSYTGLKVGAAVANTLGFALKIPVNGKKVGETVEPVYE